MPDSNETHRDAEELREWTLMFYFASDNPLAPGIVSQLKAIKNAGYHPQVNVVAQFDPHTKDTPTHIFDVNRINKLKDPEPNIGFRADDPYVRNLVLDKLWSNEESGGKLIKTKLIEFLRKGSNGERGIEYHAPEPQPPLLSVKAKSPTKESGNGAGSGNDRTSEPSPMESLRAFLQFGVKNYPARHYMLFILGHGLVVGNDMFLYDANAREESLSLRNLGELLNEFKTNIGKVKTDGDPAQFDLIGFHSCSMSSLEVAYELNGIANYMLASQGPAFVGSWAYREMLIRMFKDQEARAGDGDKPSILSTIGKMFDYISYNSYDFQLAGYSFDLALCDLQGVETLTEKLDNLSESLIAALENPLAQQLIVVAHWEAQSFWQESYTDIYDFCSCLIRGCIEMLPISNGTKEVLQPLIDNARAVQEVLKSNRIERSTVEAGKQLILRAEFAGPEYQYSHGLSVYFPWSQPVNRDFWTNEYPAYAQNTPPGEAKPKENSWFKFLEAYFIATRRDPVFAEMEALAGRAAVRQPTMEQELLEGITSKIFNTHGLLNHSAGTLDDPGPPFDKPGGGAATGGDCGCPGIKNYPSFTRAPRGGSSDDTNPATSLPMTGFVQSD